MSNQNINVKLKLHVPEMPMIRGSLSSTRKYHHAVIRVKEAASSYWNNYTHSTKVPVAGSRIAAQNILDSILQHYIIAAFQQVERLKYLETLKETQRLTLAELFTEWLEHKTHISNHQVFGEMPIEQVTLEGYQCTVVRHIIPYLKANDLNRQLVSETTREDIIAYYQHKLDCGRLDGRGGLAIKSLIQHQCVINQAFEYAIANYHCISTNVASNIHIGQADKPTAQFYNTRELTALLKASKNEVLFPIIYMTAIYGMRRSEVIGLKWDAIDFADGTILIKHTVVKCMTTTRKDKAKTKSSLRRYPMLSEVEQLLCGMLKQQKMDAAEHGKSYFDTEYVFRWADGKPIAADYVSQRFTRILHNSGLRHIRFHDLRHSTASGLLAMGYSLKEVADWLGHSSVRVTADTYSHLSMEHKRKMGAAFETVLGFK